MKFVPRENKIEVRTYSPWLDKSAADEQNQFDLAYPMTTKRLSSETGLCVTRTSAGSFPDKTQIKSRFCESIAEGGGGHGA
jgi:hypothetical protein